MTTPDPPLRCLAIAEGHKYPKWWTKEPNQDWWWAETSAHGNAEDHELTVVPHPRNDPEAVAMIEKAKR